MACNFRSTDQIIETKLAQINALISDTFYMILLSMGNISKIIAS